MAEKIDSSELHKIVIGRVKPHIYSFVTNTLPNYLKVGDTYRPVEERLNEWRKYYRDLEETFRHPATIHDDVFFRDYAVHKYLIQKGFVQIEPNIRKNVHSKEFFDGAQNCDVSDAIKDIVKKYKKADTYQYYLNSKERFEYRFSRTEVFNPRDNQQVVIDTFEKAVKAGRENLLMYAVMRFGKSITSLWCAKNINSKLTVIVSGKADVKTEWKYTAESHVDFKGYRFLDKTDLVGIKSLDSLYGKKFKTAESEEVCTNLILFLTLQDLAGSTAALKEHHRALKNAQIDLLVIDETHFGARAQVLGKLLAGIALSEAELKFLKTTLEDEEKITSADKLITLNTKIKLHLSGTPYRILMGSEFESEDIIAFVQFSDIYEAKLKWISENLDKSEWENPYYGFPQMIRFAFNPNENSRKKLTEISGSKPADLFEPNNIKKEGGYQTFVHETEVVELLQVLDGTKSDKNLLSILDHESVKEGSLAQHVVVVLPYRASCDALEKLLKNKSKSFKNLRGYTIFNLSGYDSTLNKVDDIKLAIAEAAKNKQKTLTLTVNKMLTGSTVPQWDTMLYLKGTASPQEYDQAIFRLQSPWVEKYQDSNGDVIKYDMKPQTLLVDLDPTRLFYLQERKAFAFGANTQNVGNENVSKNIERELKVSPIIALNAEQHKLVEVTATSIMDEVRQYANERTIVEDVRDVGIDLALREDKDIFSFINKLAELGDKNGLNIKPNQEEGEEYETPSATEKKGTDGTLIPGATDSESTEDISSFEKRFRTYYVMILLFAFLSNTEEKSLSDVINNIDKNKDNRRIAANLGLKKNHLELIRTKMHPYVLSTLDYKIQNTDYRSSDASISLVKHIEIAINKFGRLSESEIFTSEHIVNRMYEAFDVKFWKDAKNAKVLDIASKSGNFARGFFVRALQNGVKIEDLKDNFYSIPTSKAAYEFTRKMYEAIGLNIDNIAQHITSYDLINHDVAQLQTQLGKGKKLSDIELKDLEESGKIEKKNTTIMKFTAVVGNPPYQASVEGNTRAMPIYNYFIDTAQQLSDIVCLIHPARFLFDAGQTPKLWNRKMLNDPNFTVILYEQNSEKLFPNTDIKGGVSVTYWNKTIFSGGLKGKFIPIKELASILSKVNQGGFEKIVFVNTAPAYAINPKRPKDKKIRSNAFTELPEIFHDKPDSKHRIKIIGVINNTRTEKFVLESLTNDPILNKWKVFLPESNGSGKLGEVLSSPFVVGPGVGCAQTFVQIGSFSNEGEANSCIKYIKTKFCRVLLGTLKVTQHNPKATWKNVPLQDFTKESDIDWSKSIAEIDKQLYKKYRLDKAEIEFIEKNVKPMT